MGEKITTPDWLETAPAKGTYRSIFRWGAPDRFKHPSPGFLRVIKNGLDLPDDYFSRRLNTAEVPVKHEIPPGIPSEAVAAIASIVGDGNVSTDDYSRLKYATGKSMEDIMRLRDGKAGYVCDCAVHPRDKNDVMEIVKFCNEKKIPVHVYGGGSSVTLGLESRRGGVTLVMGTHMNRVLGFNEANQTITVEPGLMGPAYEDMLNNAPERFGARHRYTGGHFPQSFEFSSVGGWVVTLGSGQASSYYGDAYDIVVSQEYVTPAGSFKTLEYPATATGPKVNDIMKGSEGCFGVLVGLTMKVFRYFPENARQFSFMLPDWRSAVDAAREISQGEFGMPAILRISDPEETDVAVNMYGIAGTPADSFLVFRGFKPGKRCLLIGQADGEKGFARNVAKNAKKICRRYGGMSLTAYPTKKWMHSRFMDPYMREDLNDIGIVIDTLETSVTWDNLHNLHEKVRRYIKENANAICMTHASHFYPQGTNLYFIFITPWMKTDDYLRFHRGIIEAIMVNGGSLSHHHGVGRMMGPLMERHLGREQMDVLRALKRHFDPNGIMNPVETLGLD